MMWRSGAGIAVLAAGLVLAPAAEGAFPGQNGRIAFDRDGGSIVTIGPKGKQTWLARGDDPAFSPNGRAIAFARLGGGIIKMRANGEGQRRLTHQYDVDPAFSPDGSKIAFVSDRIEGLDDRDAWMGRTEFGIWIMNSNGSGARNLTEPLPTSSDHEDSEPTFSPSGKRIVFTRYHDGDLWSIRPNGRGERPVTNTERRSETSPDFAPDGSRIAFQLCESGGCYIAIMRPDGSRLRRLTRTRGTATLAFSPDGRRITFSDEGDHPTHDGGDLFTIGVNGEGRRRVTQTGAADQNPSWGPQPR